MMKALRSLIPAAVCALVALLLMPATDAAAQDADLRSNTRKFFLHAHLNPQRLDVEGAEAEFGGGLGLRLGYGFGRVVTVYLGLDAAAFETDDPFVEVDEEEYGVGTLDLGAQFHFGAGQRAFVPYLDVALTGQGVVFDTEGDETTVTGGGVTLGGGFKYFIARTFAFDTGLLFTLGNFSEGDGEIAEDIDLDATTTRLNVGFSWYPFK